ncbi:MAG: hypothetical protein ABFQ62_04235 [Patescibacteria group bacterium]
MPNLSSHQKSQLAVINKIERRVKNNTMNFSTVEPVSDYDTDNRMSLTSVHFPRLDLLEKIQNKIISPLKEIQPEHYYYKNSSLHLTIKNIRVINDPPNFNKNDIKKVKEVFTRVIPKHKKFKVYFYRLLLFPANLALVGTTEPELDDLVLELDRELKKSGVPDDKKYANKKYFFSNMTLARFYSTPNEEFKAKVSDLSKQINFKPYVIDSVSLVEANAIMVSCEEVGEWGLT